MKRIYGNSEMWSKKNWKESFQNLANDGYSFEQIEIAEWFGLGKLDGWKISVLAHTTAHKIIDETEKAVKYSIVNQYGEEYEMWFPKSVIINYSI